MNENYYSLELDQIDSINYPNNDKSHLLDVILLVFIIPNIYFINNSTSCQHIEKEITISLWLEIDTFILLFSTILLLFNKNKLLEFVLIFNKIVIFIWTIIGMILFFNYIQPTNECKNDITDYIIIRFLIVIIFCIYKLIKYLL